MNPLVIPYPEIDPVLVQLGPLAIRWYALAYIAGLVVGWQVIRRLCEQPPKVLTPVKIDDFLLWAALGVILGGRLGYVLFYKPGFYLENPLAILTLWEGGMSFHGGFGRLVAALVLFAGAKDQIVPAGRPRWPVRRSACSSAGMANFINGELWGRRPMCPGPWCFRAAVRCRAIPASSTKRCSKASCCSSNDALSASARLAKAGPHPGAFSRLRRRANVGEHVPRARRSISAICGAQSTMGMLLSVPLLFIGAWLITRA